MNDMALPLAVAADEIIEPRRDLLFEAVAYVAGINLDELTRKARSSLNGAVAELREIDPDPNEVIRRARNYWTTYRKRPTPHALVKHWPSLDTPNTEAPRTVVRQALGEIALDEWLQAKEAS